MATTRRTGTPRREIPMTSFLDMFLALLVFPMVSIGAWNAAVSVKLPEAKSPGVPGASGRERALFVYVSQEGTSESYVYHVGGDADVEPEAARTAKEASALVKRTSEGAGEPAPVIVCIDRSCPHRYVADLLSELTEVGVGQVRLRVRRL